MHHHSSKGISGEAKCTFIEIINVPIFMLLKSMKRATEETEHPCYVYFFVISKI